MLRVEKIGVFKILVSILFVLFTSMAFTGEATRVMRDKVFDLLLENQLPRGPVPPSSASLCHNKLDPFSHDINKFSGVDDDILCP